MEQHKIQYCILVYLIFLTGWYLNSYGVLIPYYSQTSMHDETYYSFLFLVRSAAYTLGSIAVKYIAHRFNTQAIFLIYTTIIAVTLFLCSLSIHPANLTVMLFLSGFCVMSSNILTFSLTVKFFYGKQPQFYIVLLGVFFGMGATLAPVFTMLFELHTYKIFALLTALGLLMVLKYPFPNIDQESNKRQSKKMIGGKSELFLCLLMLIFPIQEIGFSSWMPTYSIKSGIADTQTSGIYSLYFWLPNTISRIVWTFFIPWSITKRLKVITTTLALLSFLLVVFQYMEQYTLVCTIGPLAFGSMVGCYFGFCLSLPLDNGFFTNTNNNANFMIAYCIGEGILLGPVGYLMNIFSFRALMFMVLICCMMSAWTFNKTLVSMADDKCKEGEEGVLQEYLAK